jgi:hypothetical protein
LLDAGRADEALARIDSLAPSDAAWGAGILTQLREASVQKGDPAVFSRPGRPGCSPPLRTRSSALASISRSAAST